MIESVIAGVTDNEIVRPGVDYDAIGSPSVEKQSNG